MRDEDRSPVQVAYERGAVGLDQKKPGATATWTRNWSGVARFLGANNPYKVLKTTLKAEIDPDAWESLHSETSRPFHKPQSGASR